MRSDAKSVGFVETANSEKNDYSYSILCTAISFSFVYTLDSFLGEVERVTDGDVREHDFLQISSGDHFAWDGLILGKETGPLEDVGRDEAETSQAEHEDERLQDDPTLKVVEPAQPVDAAGRAHELGPAEDDWTQLLSLCPFIHFF